MLLAFTQKTPRLHQKTPKLHQTILKTIKKTSKASEPLKIPNFFPFSINSHPPNPFQINFSAF
jgi:hypothetical protein